MFVSFLNKTHPNCPDLSALSNYPPGKVLFYYTSASLHIDLDHYLTLKEVASGDNTAPSPITEWLYLIDQELAAEEDLLILKENEYLESMGPYYFAPTNTRFYFVKNQGEELDSMTIQDLDLLEGLHEISAPEPAVQTYGKNKKAKRYTRNKEEILRDIRMCQAALKCLGNLQKQINFWEKALETRQLFLSNADLLPSEPGNPPNKPEKADDKTKKSIGFLSPFTKKRKQGLNSKYQHDMKIYYIRYREYEKACDRFKSALENWPALGEMFHARCQQDSDMAEEKLATARGYLSLYNLILNRSIIHPKYQDSATLSAFQHYLETGRAEDLQECMNIFEEESLWNDIKEGQNRIENTIYLLQNESAHLQYAEEQIDEYLGAHKAQEERLAEAK
ncbi:MAG TPA: hypothetical protein VN426_12685 [Syntrophomonadaceae bacterium]|nr:hypothetical protein [Syntrophomonadaceae bacterium]